MLGYTFTSCPMVYACYTRGGGGDPAVRPSTVEPPPNPDCRAGPGRHIKFAADTQIVDRQAKADAGTETKTGAFPSRPTAGAQWKMLWAQICPLSQSPSRTAAGICRARVGIRHRNPHAMTPENSRFVL